MRKLRFTLIAAVALAAFTFTSCDKDETPEIPYTLKIVGFEDATLPAAGYIVGEDYAYTEKEMTFAQYYTDWGGGMTSWSGFAVSNKTNKTDPSAITNGFSVYGSGGAGSSQFGVIYYSSWDGPAECSFADGVEYEMEYAYVTNATVAYLSVLNGDGFGKAFSLTDKDWFRVTVTGYDAAGTETGSKEVYLADYRGAAPFIMSEWTKIDLTALGAVNTIGFSFASTDNDPDNGINTPTYLCIDNIAYREYVTQ